MKFAEIIREAGLKTEKFPKCSNIEICFYDGKNRIITEKEVHYVETLFKNNEPSFKNFQLFLNSLENEDIHAMNVKVDINSVVLFYKTPRAIVFMRNNSMDPLDYMD